MKILHVSDRLTERGGAYWHMLGIIAHQSRMHDVRLVVGSADDGVQVGCPTLSAKGLDARGRAPCDISDVVASFGPDVIHVHTVMNPDALEQLGSLRSARKVLTVQDHRYFCPGKGKWTEGGEVCDEPMSAALCRACFHDDRYYEDILELTRARLQALEAFELVVLSRYMRDELEKVGASSLHVIPPFVHGLDDDADVDGAGPCILFVGRLVENKGGQHARAAWKRAATGLPLVVAGAGRARDAFAGCEMLGWVPHGRLGALYRRAEAVIMASRWQEPFGIVGLEAMSLGTPVAAWDSGGVREWHPEPTAWGDVDALAAQLVRVVGGRVRAPTGFEPEPLMERLTAVYQG